MAKTVQEIMNRELFSLGPDEPAEQALHYIVELGITGAPVLDQGGRPVGVASFRDLLARKDGASVAARMTTPPLTVDARATIEDAGRLLGEAGVHRLIVTDDEGRAIGVASALDVLRGLLGMPAPHPATFPHYDPLTGVTWTDDAELSLAKSELAPDGPGLLVLVHGGRGLRETVVWAEAPASVRARLRELISVPQIEWPQLAKLLSHPANVRFRAAAMPVGPARMRALETLLREVAGRLEAAALR